jgi:hypothetical protein
VTVRVGISSVIQFSHPVQKIRLDSCLTRQKCHHRIAVWQSRFGSRRCPQDIKNGLSTYY